MINHSLGEAVEKNNQEEIYKWVIALQNATTQNLLSLSKVHGLAATPGDDKDETHVQKEADAIIKSSGFAVTLPPEPEDKKTNGDD